MGDLRRTALLIIGIAMSLTPTATAHAARDDESLARAAARRFLERYVEDDGRVARIDQGDDTVGEGQSYALALAIVAEDDETFDRVWEYIDEHLRRDDGLLVHHANADGSVDDEDAATDADVVTAWALLRADHNDEQRAAGEAIADTILEKLTVEVGDGQLLAAGTWATGSPATLNPSYWALAMLDDLAGLAGDDRWSDLRDDSLSQLEAVTDSGARLPPDWARADGEQVSATPAPSGDPPDVRYSLDAQRVVVWCATGGATDLAAEWWTTLERRGRAGAIALDPEGEVIDGTRHPLGYVAAAAAAFSAGDDDAGRRLLRRAAALDRRTPTYYGAAWIALGRALLTTDLLGGEQP